MKQSKKKPVGRPATGRIRKKRQFTLSPESHRILKAMFPDGTGASQWVDSLIIAQGKIQGGGR